MSAHPLDYTPRSTSLKRQMRLADSLPTAGDVVAFLTVVAGGIGAPLGVWAVAHVTAGW